MEANGEVCYAYLLNENQIIGDVWLGNQIAPSEKADFSDPSKMPFLNPKEFLTEPEERLEDFEPRSIDWKTSSTSNSKKVTVEFSNMTTLVLEEGVRPHNTRFQLSLL